MASATYTSPALGGISLVRWYLGDTATGSGDACNTVVNPLVTDTEILFALSQKNNDAKMAAAFCARYAAVKLVHDPQSIRLLDFSVSSNVSPTDLARSYEALADQLENEGVRPGVYAGGISVADKEAVAANTDRVKPIFYRGLHDYPGSLD